METRKLTRITMKRILLVLNCILLSIGNCGAPLMLRLYFIHGGQRIWLSSWLQTGGWPIISIPLAIAYFRRRKSCSSDATTKLFYMKTALFIASTIIGILTGVDNYFYAYGLARLPVSTLSLIIATQLAFTAGFAFLLVKQKFTSYTINAIFLLTAGAGVLAMHTSGDKPGNESNRLYILGYVFTLTAAALYGFILPLVELAYKKCMQEINYTLVLEIQMILCLFATVFCTVGSLVNKDFQAIPREARNFGLGEAKYYTVLVFIAITAQCFFLGSIGVIFCASSLLSGVIIAVGLPVTEILAVLFFKEKFRPEKGLALALSLWGFLSYFYGEVKEHKKKNPASKTEMAQIPNPVENV